jgi:O-antigen/teichoic acid export membrane protein
LLPYGKDFQGGEAVARWLMTGSIAYSLVWPVNSILISMGRMWLWCGQVVLYMALYLALGWWLIPRYGAVGYAMSATIAFAISNVPCVVFLYLKLAPVMRRIRWLTMGTLVSGLLFICWFAAGPTNKPLSLVLGVAAAVTFGAWRLLTLRDDLGKPARAAEVMKAL